MAMLYYPDGSSKEVHPEDGQSISLYEMHALIGGDLDFVHLDGGWCLIVDDTGALKGLPYNPAATALYALSGGQSGIFGPALHCRLRNPGLADEVWD